MILLGVFAGIALLLASVGIYGVISFVVGQRTHEIGVRMALGARAGDILALVVRQGMTLGGIGIAAGLIGAMLVMRVMSSLLFGVSAHDAVTFGVVAMILAAIGIYGLMAYSVAQRTQEIGVRIALGAKRRDVLRLVAREGVPVIGVGLLVGLVLSLGLTRLISSIVYGVSATDGATLLAVSGILTATAILAVYVPARRAMRVDPMVALMYE